MITYRVIYANPGSSPALNAVLTDRLPNTGLTEYVTGSAPGAVYDPATHSLTWNLGTVPAGALVELTYQVRVTPQAAHRDMLVNDVTLTHTSGFVQASASVRVVARYDVVLAIYNEAGELVSVLGNFAMSRPLNAFETDGTPLEREGDVVRFLMDGLVIGSWDGRNADGNLVTGGQYYVKVDSTDAFNVTTSVTRTVSVNFDPRMLEIVVYNEAGEVVRHIGTDEIEAMLAASGGGLSADDFEVGGVDILNRVIIPSLSDPTGDGHTVRVVLKSGNVIYWDGRNNDGDIVTTGQYYLEIRSRMGNEREQVRTVPVAVLASPGGLSTVRLAPNPVTLPATSQARFLVSGPPGHDATHVKVYAVSGELVQRLLSDPGNPGTVVWDVRSAAGGRLASGLYLAVVELQSGSALLERHTLKVLVVR